MDQSLTHISVPDLIQPNPIFKNYQSMFANFLDAITIHTTHDVINIHITYDSSRAITVTKESDSVYWINMYDLDTYEITFSEKVEGTYIKCNEVQQNSEGSLFALTYFNDGNFRIRTFGKENRTDEEIKANEFDVNKALDIDSHMMPNKGFPDPFIVSSFIDDKRLFVALFHNHTLTHYHFIYDIEGQHVDEKVTKAVMSESSA